MKVKLARLKAKVLDKFQRLAQNRPLLFVTIFAVVGLISLGLSLAETTPNTVVPPPAGSNYNRILKNDEIFPNGFTVPANEVWGFEPGVSTTVKSSGNVIVKGTLAMEPTSASVVHTLQFIGIDESKFIGGHTEVPLASDVGLWVVENGNLYAVGTPKSGWNRTGTDPTWNSSDEILVVPQTKGFSDSFVKYSGSVPSVQGPDGVTYKTEVFNTTRNVRITGGGSNPSDILTNNGRAHIIFLRCTKPQTLKYVELRYMGPRGPHSRDVTDGRLGRYGLHFHLCGESARGSVVEGVIARDIGNSSFVAHASHGVTFKDTIAYNVWENAYWWDDGTESNDILFDHAAAFLVKDYPVSRGYSLDGFTLGKGIGNTVRDSVVAASMGHKANAGGFNWPSKANKPPNVWTFVNNVAHSIRGGGIGVWQNTPTDHLVDDFVSYYNGLGVSHGAYGNNYHYRGGVMFGNGADIVLHALPKDSTTAFQLWEDLLLAGNMAITKHTLPSRGTVIFRNVEVRGKIQVNETNDGGNIGGNIRFESTNPRSDLSLSDFELISKLSKITVVNSDGSTFEVQ